MVGRLKQAVKGMLSGLPLSQSSDQWTVVSDQQNQNSEQWSVPACRRYISKVANSHSRFADMFIVGRISDQQNQNSGQ
jgi:hypothetical protein